MDEFEEARKVVEHLNWYFYDNARDKNGFLPFHLHSDGTETAILYCGFRDPLWLSSEDERIFHEETNSYEPLIDFVVRRVDQFFNLRVISYKKCVRSFKKKISSESSS